jgi:hypothetical protein
MGGHDTTLLTVKKLIMAFIDPSTIVDFAFSQPDISCAAMPLCRYSALSALIPHSPMAVKDYLMLFTAC